VPESLTKNTPASDQASNDSENAKLDRPFEITDRQSRELFIALCGPIGSGIHSVADQLESALLAQGYIVKKIRVSDAIKTYCSRHYKDILIDESDRYERYSSLMDAGNALRQKEDPGFCAKLAISEIAIIHDEMARGVDGEKELNATKEVGLNQTAYIIDQLKHPKEISILKDIYRNNFYLVGVLCGEEQRENSLTGDGINRAKAHDLIERDKKENEEYGQQLEKTLFDADFFINNTDTNASSLSSSFSRFLKLIHGGEGVTPTKQELGMYAAYTSSLQSACLSRQVGAAIVDENGDIIATGKNDVPKFGGGLYSEDDHTAPNSQDFRCVHKDQQCHNDLHKLKLKEQIEQVLVKNDIDAHLGKQLSEQIYRNTPIKSLIEFSRAIHAEMDALLSFTRSGKHIPKNSVLYTTTFPCHNCARHIVASGIKKIVYIEPYEKSLALKLHGDAISALETSDKVHVVSFQGIAPRRYQVFFSNTSPLKNELGKIIKTDRNPHHVDRGFIDSYIEHELKIANEITKMT